MEKREENDYLPARPTEKIKFQNLKTRVMQEEINKLETSKEYKLFRQLKQISVVCKDKQQVLMHYKPSKTNETIIGKIDTYIFKCLPYSYNDEPESYSIWELPKQMRDKFKEFNEKDFYPKNILKLEFRGKTIYQNEEFENKGEQK